MYDNDIDNSIKDYIRLKLKPKKEKRKPLEQ